MKKSIKKFEAKKQLEAQSLKQINGGGISLTISSSVSEVEAKEAAGKDKDGD